VHQGGPSACTARPRRAGTTRTVRHGRRAGRLLAEARLAFDRRAFSGGAAAAQQSQAFPRMVSKGVRGSRSRARIFSSRATSRSNDPGFVWNS